MERTLYVSDLDGTLLDSQSKVSPASAALLNRAVGEGALFTIATARTPATVDSLMAGVKLRLPAVVMTGAALWHQATRSLSDFVTIPPDAARRVLDAFKAGGVPGFVYFFRKDKIEILHWGPLNEAERLFMEERSKSFYKKFLVPPSGNSEFPEHLDPHLYPHLDDVALFYSMQPTELSRSVYECIRDEAQCNVLFYHDIFGPETAVLEVFARKASKAEAVKRLAAQCGATRIVAFGDNINDLPMLEIADVAVAVENAVPEVKERASVVIGPNTDNSVAAYILSDFKAHRCGAAPPCS